MAFKMKGFTPFTKKEDSWFDKIRAKLTGWDKQKLRKQWNRDEWERRGPK